MSTATVKKKTATAPARNAATDEPVIVPGVDVGAFLRQIAADNAELAKRIAEFRAAHVERIDESQRANLAGLARGHSRIANTLARDNAEAAPDA
jgi:hypothetical protein